MKSEEIHLNLTIKYLISRFCIENKKIKLNENYKN